MLSFPSTLNKGGSNLNNPTTSNSAKDLFTNSFKSAFTKTVSGITSNKALDTDGIDYDETRDYDNLITNLDFTKKVEKGDPQSSSKISNYEDFQVLDERKFGLNVLNSINNYRKVLNGLEIDAGIDSPATDDYKKYYHRMFTVENTAPSLFSQMYGVTAKGITFNVPLTDYESNHGDSGVDVSDCSISNLVKLSQQEAGPLGLARYKYADFMYCRDIGKIANNHLITLRKFSIPCGDNIFTAATVSKAGGAKNGTNMTLPADVGRMVTWFGNEENKLEDILSYDYEATFIQKEGKIQQLDSQEEDESRGPMGKIINSLSANYNKDVAKGTANNAILNYAVKRFGLGLGKYLSPPTYAHNDVILGRNYDNNKVYEPRDTVRDTYIYEGKLVFKHEFALTFNYKLRSYDGINPKSAMLDLLGNILQVTYRKGHFWGGSSQIIGPQPNYDGWRKANAFVDKAVNKTGSFLSTLFGGDGLDVSALAGFVSNVISGIGGVATGLLETFTDADKAKNAVNAAAKTMKKYWNVANLGAAATGMLKNSLGRPSVYAFDSILTGSNVGLWHVTIGNPLNPICVFGNLIMTNCKITHSGPLGLDDFPTDLKVTVSLKHGRGRDSVDISKMYTMGETGICMSLNSRQASTGTYPFERYKLTVNTNNLSGKSESELQDTTETSTTKSTTTGDNSSSNFAWSADSDTIASGSFVNFGGSYDDYLRNTKENEG